MVSDCPENYTKNCVNRINNMLEHTLIIQDTTMRILHIRKVFELTLSEYCSPFIMKHLKFRKGMYKQLIKNIKEIEELQNLDEIQNNNPNILDFFYNAKTYIESLGGLEENPE